MKMRMTKRMKMRRVGEGQGQSTIEFKFQDDFCDIGQVDRNKFLG